MQNRNRNRRNVLFSFLVLSFVACLLLTMPVPSSADLNQVKLTGRAYRLELLTSPMYGVERSIVYVHAHDTRTPPSTAAGVQPAFFTCPTGSCVDPVNVLGCPNGAAPVLESSTPTLSGSMIHAWGCPDGVDGACLAANGFINFEGGSMAQGLVLYPFAVTIGKDESRCGTLSPSTE